MRFSIDETDKSLEYQGFYLWHGNCKLLRHQNTYHLTFKYNHFRKGIQMKLELRKIAIKDVCFDKECKIVDGCLHVDPAKLEDLVLEDSRVKSVSFDGYDLLAADDDSNVFPFTKEQNIREKELESMLCEGYGIPSKYLNLIYNEKPMNEIMWLDRKFKRNFRSGIEVHN